MTHFISIDENNRVIGERFGSYDLSDKFENEIDITDLDLPAGKAIHALFDDSTKTLIFDQEYEDFHQPPPVVYSENYNYSENDAANLVQEELDKKAKQYQYDSIFTAATYANSTNPIFKADALAFISWRDNVWNWAYDKLNKINTFQIQKPSLEHLLDDMPQFVPPEYNIPAANTP